jgi:Short C-terminal domain
MGKRRAESQEPAMAPPDQDVPSSAPPSPPAAESGMGAEQIQRLQELAELHKQGVLTDAEFAAQKARILGD